MFYSLQKIVLDNFPRNCLIWSSTGFISGLQDFTPYFHFRCVAHANLIHSVDVCSLVIVCVGYTCAHAAKNPQNSFTFASVFLPKCIVIRQQQKVNTLPKPGKKLCVMPGLMMTNCKCVIALSCSAHSAIIKKTLDNWFIRLFIHTILWKVINVQMQNILMFWQPTMR